VDKINFPERIMKIEESSKWIKWRLACLCDSNSHDWSFDIEYDSDVNEILMSIWADMLTGAHYGYHKNWFVDKINDWRVRLRIVFRVLFFGYYEASSDIAFKTKKDIEVFISALQQSIEKIESSGRGYGEFDITNSLG
jgi:hypothetical protein